MNHYQCYIIQLNFFLNHLFIFFSVTKGKHWSVKEGRDQLGIPLVPKPGKYSDVEPTGTVSLWCCLLLLPRRVVSQRNSVNVNSRCRLIYGEVVVGQLSLAAIIQSSPGTIHEASSPIHAAKSFDIWRQTRLSYKIARINVAAAPGCDRERYHITRMTNCQCI